MPQGRPCARGMATAPRPALPGRTGPRTLEGQPLKCPGARRSDASEPLHRDRIRGSPPQARVASQSSRAAGRGGGKRGHRHPPDPPRRPGQRPSSPSCRQIHTNRRPTRSGKRQCSGHRPYLQGALRHPRGRKSSCPHRCSQPTRKTCNTETCPSPPSESGWACSAARETSACTGISSAEAPEQEASGGIAAACMPASTPCTCYSTTRCRPRASPLRRTSAASR
mmetsp:Transcript_110211/g.296720  ORF Transcript_110211/g.296720 Transcript_110211/m.296720 type:complete len:224 (+) Transcript_110211:3-674(+)